MPIRGAPARGTARSSQRPRMAVGASVCCIGTLEIPLKFCCLSLHILFWKRGMGSDVAQHPMIPRTLCRPPSLGFCRRTLTSSGHRSFGRVFLRPGVGRPLSGMGNGPASGPWRARCASIAVCWLQAAAIRSCRHRCALPRLPGVPCVALAVTPVLHTNPCDSWRVMLVIMHVGAQPPQRCCDTSTLPCQINSSLSAGIGTA